MLSAIKNLSFIFKTDGLALNEIFGIMQKCKIRDTLTSVQWGLIL